MTEVPPMTVDLPGLANAPVEDAMMRLNKIIAARVDIMGASMKDAVIGVAITALRSIRAATRKAKTSGEPPAKIQEMPLYAGFSNTLHKPCLRTGPQRSALRYTPKIRVRWLTHTEGRGYKTPARVWKVTPLHERAEEYFAVAHSVNTVLRFEKKASSNRAKSYGNLAKYTLGLCMARLSTKNSPGTASALAQTAAGKHTRVLMNGGLQDYSVEVADLLDYAVDAIKGGEAGLADALNKAANKSAGLIARYYTDHFGSLSNGYDAGVVDRIRGLLTTEASA